MAQLNLHCPICGQVDMVQKVSVVVESDLIQRHGEYGTYTYPSPLAKSLARPKEPKRSPTAGCGFVLGIIFLLFGGLGLYGGKSSELSLSVLLLVFGILVCIIGFSADSRDHKEYKDMLARWPKADERWSQLYYCRRDDVIFNPYESASGPMPVSNMTNYLFSDSPHLQPDLNKEKRDEPQTIISCEKCGQKLRIPLRRKNLHVACPKCKHEFNYEFIEGSPVND